VLVLLAGGAAMTPRTLAVVAIAIAAVLLWLAVILGGFALFSRPAFPATTIKPSAYDTCLMRAALRSPYYSSTDGGDSAVALIHFCDNERFDWINQCVAHDGNFYDCTLKSAVRAMLSIVLAEDARTGGR
jgi:hypothetical protein